MLAELQPIREVINEEMRVLQLLLSRLLPSLSHCSQLKQLKTLIHMLERHIKEVYNFENSDEMSVEPGRIRTYLEVGRRIRNHLEKRCSELRLLINDATFGRFVSKARHSF